MGFTRVTTVVGIGCVVAVTVACGQSLAVRDQGGDEPRVAGDITADGKQDAGGGAGGDAGTSDGAASVAPSSPSSTTMTFLGSCVWSDGKLCTYQPNRVVATFYQDSKTGSVVVHNRVEGVGGSICEVKSMPVGAVPRPAFVSGPRIEWVENLAASPEPEPDSGITIKWTTIESVQTATETDNALEMVLHPTNNGGDTSCWFKRAINQ